jgi:hypothetical protein
MDEDFAKPDDGAHKTPIDQMMGVALHDSDAPDVAPDR